MVDDSFWEDTYQKTPASALPWNAGGADPDLVRLVQEAQIPTGHALDLGTGPGHDAIFLIQHGYQVIAIDISASAIRLARENASNAGVFGFFQQGDIRRIPVEDGFVDFVNDRGCFHVLDESDRPKAVEEMARVLRRGGQVLLRVFSDQEPGPAAPAAPGEFQGPHRFTRKELEDLFSARFRILKIWEGVFEGPRRPKSYSLLMEKK